MCCGTLRIICSSISLSSAAPRLDIAEMFFVFGPPYAVGKKENFCSFPPFFGGRVGLGLGLGLGFRVGQQLKNLFAVLFFF